MGMGDNLDLVRNMVENKQGICQHQDRLREPLRIMHRTGQSLEVAGNFVAQVTDHTAMKSGKTGNGHGMKSSQFLFRQI